MDAAKWQQVKDLFSATVELAADERVERLAGETDAEVLREVRKLLSAHEEAENFIDRPILVERNLAADETKDYFVGRTIENYAIIAPLGTGGMGAVYLAERVNSDFKQKVALKIIKRGMDSETILRRFAFERKILASLRHPNIAQLIDGGISAEGLPFFVMEYVDGAPLKDFCREHRLTLKERLELFRQICAAVEHAHKNLVVHRDLKPSNILVTKDGIPKLLDFGIAKLLSGNADSEEATVTQAKMLTPEYASPEQFLGKNVTTAADIYSLGVILYELLSGYRPFQTKGKSYEEIVKSVCDSEPAAPSRVLTSAETGQHRDAQTNAEAIGGAEEITASVPPVFSAAQLRGDLDNIILKALRKEPSERYGSVQQFSEDIYRFLNGLPISARPQTFQYRFGKYVARHRAGVFAAALILLSLVGGISVATWQAVVAGRERERAERQFAETRKIANSMLFEIHDSLADLPGATNSRELLVRRALEYLNNLSQEAGENPELLRELAIAYRKVGDIQGDPFYANTGNSSEAAESYQKALEIQEKLLLEDPENLELQKELRATTMQLGDNLYSLGKNSEAKIIYRRAVEITRRVVEREPQNAPYRNSLAFLYWRLSWVADTVAEKNEYFGQARDYSEKSLNETPDDDFVISNAVEIYGGIGNALGNPDFNDAGKPFEALPYIQKAQEMRHKIVERYPDGFAAQTSLGVGYKDLGDIFLAQGKIAEALENYEKALRIHRTLAEKDPKNSLARGIVGFDLTKIGNALLKSGEIEKSLTNHKEAVETLEKLHADNPTNVMVAHSLVLALEGLADAFLEKKDFPDALVHYRRALKIDEELDAQQANEEFQRKIAQLYLKIGNTKTRIAGDCRETRTDYEKSLEIFKRAAEKTPLSPTNQKFLAEAEAKRAGCGY